MENIISDESRKAIQAVAGRTISGISVDADRVIVRFKQLGDLVLTDEHQCCEKRYFHSDDDATYLVGRPFATVDVLSVIMPAWQDQEEEQEIAFLAIRTATGTRMVISRHNIHNGYYSGISISAQVTT